MRGVKVAYNLLTLNRTNAIYKFEFDKFSSIFFFFTTLIILNYIDFQSFLIVCSFYPCFFFFNPKLIIQNLILEGLFFILFYLII